MITQVIAKTLIFNDNCEVLLLRRSDDDVHRPGGYDAPGGGTDAGESFVDAAVREAHEEAGLTIQSQSMELLYATTKPGSTDDGESASLVWLGFVTRLPDGEAVSLSHEHQGFEWCPIDAAISKTRGLTIHGFMVHLRDNAIREEYWKPAE